MLLSACETPRVAQGQCLQDKFAVDSAGNVAYPCGHEPKTAAIEPIIDTKGVDMVAYRTDLDECNGYAKRVSPGQSALAGAIAGAAVGAATGAVIGDGYGDAGHGAKYGAGLGAIGGGTSGGAQGVLTRDQVVKRCMAGRGYSVLN